MEPSLDLQFLDSSSTPGTNPADVKVAEGKCPICWQHNKSRNIIPVYYKMREAIYTCEDTNCLFFMTDDFGNLQKFTKTNGALNYSGNVTVPPSELTYPNAQNYPNGSLHPQSAPTQSNEIVDTSALLDNLFNSESNNDDVKSLMNELSDLFENEQGEKKEN